jgi:hypothetical protein
VQTPDSRDYWDFVERTAEDVRKNMPEWMKGDAGERRRPAPKPDLDAIRREAFMAGIRAYRVDDGAEWAFDQRVNGRLWRDMVEAGEQEAFTAWQAQRRGETPSE